MPEGTPTPSIASAAATVRSSLVGVIVGSKTATGVIVDPAGYILTTSAIVQGTDSAVAKLADGRDLEAMVVGRDEIRDLAILKVEAEGLPIIVWVAPGKTSVGEQIYSLGYAEGSPDGVTVVVGILGRIQTGDEAGGIYILTDISKLRGHSGGPLINRDGEVLGINTRGTLRLDESNERGLSAA